MTVSSEQNDRIKECVQTLPAKSCYADLNSISVHDSARFSGIREWVNFAYRSGSHEWQVSKFRVIADK